MASTAGAALVANPVNLSGVLFNKTRVDTPLFNSIGNTSISAREFLTGATYDTGYPTAVAGITEEASLTAPTPKFWTRENAVNVTQIFQETVSVSYRKLSNTSDLTNYAVSANQQPALAGDANNVPDERAFQIANTMDKIRLDIEWAILNSTFKDSKGDKTKPDQTRGLIAAVTTNTVAAASQELSFEMLYDTAQKLMLAGTPFALDRYIVVLSYTQFKQLQKICVNEGLKIDTTSAGVNVSTIITPFGPMRFMPHRFMPVGTAMFACIPVLGNKLQPVPGMGTFYYEPLAKTGAAETGQIFGQWGLDHGPEFVHAKITGIATTTAPFGSPKRDVLVTNPTTNPVNTKTVA